MNGRAEHVGHQGGRGKTAVTTVALRAAPATFVEVQVKLAIAGLCEQSQRTLSAGRNNKEQDIPRSSEPMCHRQQRQIFSRRASV